MLLPIGLIRTYPSWKKFRILPRKKSTKNGEDAGNVLQWYTVCSIFLQSWVIKFISRKDNELTPALAFLNNPTTVGYLVLKKFVQG